MKKQVLLSTQTVHPESDYNEIARLGQKLGIPVLQVFLSLEVTKKGKLIDSFKDRSRTFNRNFWNAQMMLNLLSPGVATNFGAGYISMKAFPAGGVNAITVMGGWTPLGIINSSNYGILVGIGTAAESFEGYKLSTLCANGSGANQLVHTAASPNTQSYDAPSRTWTITLKRIFNNNSGAPIVAAETAIIATSSSGAFMFNRDLLAEAVNIPVGAQLTVSYAFTLTLPA